jgi:hypothetical protein
MKIRMLQYEILVRGWNMKNVFEDKIATGSGNYQFE